MVTTYTLKVINKWKDAEFQFFAGTSTNIGNHIWCKATIPFGGSLEIRTDFQVYAWCGTISSDGNFEEGVVEPVTLGSSGGKPNGTTLKTVSLEGKALKFEAAEPEAPGGAFEILTGIDFTVQDNFMLGMAWPDPSDPTNIVPVETFVAYPNDRYVLSPLPVYVVVVAGDDSPKNTGTGLSKICQEWNFSGTGMNYGEVTIDADGKFSDVTYKQVTTKALTTGPKPIRESG